MSIAALMELEKALGVVTTVLAAAYFIGLGLLWLRIRFGPEWTQPSRAVQLVSRGFSAGTIVGFVFFGWTGDRWTNALLVVLRVLLAIYIPVSIGQGAIVQFEPTCMRMGDICP